MDDTRDSAGAKLAVVLVSVHIIEEKDARIFLAALIRPYDVGPVEAEDRHGRLDHPLVMADRFRKERLAVPDHEALAPDKNRYILAVDQLVIDGFWRQEDEISLELIKVARDELDFRQRHKAQVHLYHVIHRFLIKECSDFPAVFLIRPAEGIVDAPVLLVDPV